MIESIYSESLTWRMEKNLLLWTGGTPPPSLFADITTKNSFHLIDAFPYQASHLGFQLAYIIL